VVAVVPGHIRIVIKTALVCVLGVASAAQVRSEPDWAAVEQETMRHFQALLRLDTSNPPGNERRVVEYLADVLTREAIPFEVRAVDPGRPNLVARLKSTGRKRPLLIMSHTDVVPVDAAKWTHPPFGATREGGYVYGRGALDDKDNVTAGLMTMLLLKRSGDQLDRDVILLAEAGEEGTTKVGIEFMVNQHFADIDAEYCLAEGNGPRRRNGAVQYATVLTAEKRGRVIELVARGLSGQGSVPLADNAIVRLGRALARLGEWRPAIRLSETTTAYFQRLAALSPPDLAKHYRAIVSNDAAARAAADRWLFEHDPSHAAMIRTSIAPTLVSGGVRQNVIPSEAKATLDVRFLPEQDADALLEQVKKVIDDPNVDVGYPNEFARPLAPGSRVDSDAFRAIEASMQRVYGVATLPVLSNGATDMAFLRAKGIDCYGIGPANDVEDVPRGFGPHSDQERILESELHRFVRVQWQIVQALGSRASGDFRIH
jgi:acetylornithine deacetylase/succinyl-diaminopimelate desuccinylase-like protein